MNKDKLNKNIRRAFFIYVIFFTILFLHLLNFSFSTSKNVVNSHLNPRTYTVKDNIERGDFYSSEMIKLTERKNTDEYLYSELYSHILGFSEEKNTNLEICYGLELQKVSNRLKQSLNADIKEEDQKGNSVQLSINHKLQEKVHSLLSDKIGTIVVLDAKSNKFLAMDSSPTFNPNKIEEDNSYIDDNFLNRATYSLYESSQIPKIITALTFINTYENYDTYTYTCNGTITKNGVTINCVDNVAHGTQTLSEALENSCTTFFVEISDYFEQKDIEKTYKDFLFNHSFDFEFEIAPSTLKEIENTEEYFKTLVGINKVEITPLHMSLIFSSIENNGNFFLPTFKKSTLDNNNNIIKTTKTKTYKKSYSDESFGVLKEILTTNMANYSLTSLNSENYSNDETTKVFTGVFNENENPIVITIIYENDSSDSSAYNDALTIFDYYSSEVVK